MRSFRLLLSASLLTLFCSAFVTPPTTASQLHHHKTTPTLPFVTNQQQQRKDATQLFLGGALVNVPDGFFTITFPLLGVMLQISKQVNRARLEERAFDLRLAEARELKMQQDPSLTESELIRQEAAQDVSYYGPDAVERRQETKERTQSKVTVIERDDTEAGRRYTLSDEEIEELQAMGVEYDPYYDDPYTEEEMPEDDAYRQDKRYGDRIYDNGEVFYKDADTGLFYRQGAKPRSSSFWAGSRN